MGRKPGHAVDRALRGNAAPRHGAWRRVVAFLAQPDSISWHTRIVASWDLGALAYLGLAWALMAKADASVTRDHALSQDQSGYIIFLFVVGASCASIVAIGFVVGTIRDLPFWIRAWHLALTVAALVSSWLLIQTVFAFHYAHRYYAGPHGETAAAAPLLFPGGREPDYVDFAYYSFVVGMTSQVSDVAVASRSMRQADDDPRHPCVRVQHRRARAQHQHHCQRDLAAMQGDAKLHVTSSDPGLCCPPLSAFFSFECPLAFGIASRGLATPASAARAGLAPWWPADLSRAGLPGSRAAAAPRCVALPAAGNARGLRRRAAGSGSSGYAAHAVAPTAGYRLPAYCRW